MDTLWIFFQSVSIYSMKYYCCWILVLAHGLEVWTCSVLLCMISQVEKYRRILLFFEYQIQHFYLEKKFTLKIKPKKFVDFSPAWCLSLVNISKVSYCDTNSTMKIVSSLIQKCSLQDKLDMACRNFFLLWLFLHVQGAPAIRGVP